MKIALAQLNLTIGDITGNTAKIAAACERAREQGARLLVTSELAICGYPPRDWLLQSGYAEACQRAVEQLAHEQARDGLAILVGSPQLRTASQPRMEPPDRTRVLSQAELQASLEALEHGTAPHTPRPGQSPATPALGKPLSNAAFLLDAGEIKAVATKRLLPTYNVFDEERYFHSDDAPARCLELDGVKLGVHICEDGWNDANFWQADERLHQRDPVEELVADGAEMLINLSASPWSWHTRSGDRAELRERLIASAASRHRKPALLVNQVGGQDAVIYDGTSAAVNASGVPIARLASFEEDLRVLDVGHATQGDDAMARHSWQGPARTRLALELGLRDYLRKCGFSKVVLGLSGGIDSALVATIACHAIGAENVRCIGMPSHFSSQGSVTDSEALASNLGCSFEQIPIQASFDTMLQALTPHFSENQREFGLTEENIQPRLRGTILMALSNKTGAMLLATGNKSELAVGYSTLYGDMCGGLQVIGDLYKGEVVALCREYNREQEIIPEAIITKEPSAELRPDQRDTDSLPPYGLLDQVLEAYIDQARSAQAICGDLLDAHPGLSEDEARALVDRVLKLVDRSEYKRFQAPPILRVHWRSFGQPRQLPLAQRYQH